MTNMQERRTLAQERADIKDYAMSNGGDMKGIVLAVVNLAEQVLNLAEGMELREEHRVELRKEAARLEVEETPPMETPYLAIPPLPNKPDWRDGMRSLLENARPAVEAMKTGMTQDYMLNPTAMIAFFDALEEALRETASDTDWRSLPEYSASLPTWQMGDDGELIGCRKWKRLWKEPGGKGFWIIGEAFMFTQTKRVHILWSRPDPEKDGAWNTLLVAQKEYIKFLTDEIVRNATFLAVHGMGTPFAIMEEGTRLRERIRSLGGTVPE